MAFALYGLEKLILKIDPSLTASFPVTLTQTTAFSNTLNIFKYSSFF